MKIESQLRSCRSTPRTVTKTDKTQAGKFQQALGAVPQEPKDTFTLSSRAPTVEETPVNAAALGASTQRPAIEDASNAAPQTAAPASATEILPGDTTEVKLAKLRKMSEEADYTGMAYDEIQSAIYNRYNDVFNGNMAAIITFVGGSGLSDWGEINNQFVDETRDYVWIPMLREFEAETGIRGAYFFPSYSGTEEDKAFSQYVSSKYGNLYAAMLGYGDMGIEETEQVIYKKYAGKDTLRDFLTMQGELYHSGVLTSKFGGEGAWAYISAISYQLPKTYFPDIYYKAGYLDIPQSRWDAVLDGKFDAQAFASDMRESLKTANFSGVNFDIQGAISQGIDYLLEAVAKAQQAELERHAEREKQVEQAELVKQAE